MARTTTTLTTITDSLTGKELKEGQFEEITLQLGKKRWTLDLSSDSMKKLEAALEPFIKNETEKAAKTATKSTYPDGYLNKVREWANANGHSVYSKGLVKKSIIAEYEAAMNQAK